MRWMERMQPLTQKTEKAAARSGGESSVEKEVPHFGRARRKAVLSKVARSIITLGQSNQARSLNAGAARGKGAALERSSYVLCPL